MITADKVSIGLGVGARPPLKQITLLTRGARWFGFDAVWTVDHFQGWFPRALWNRDLTWMAAPGTTPHAYFDYQALMGHLAGRAGRLQIGVGVTEPIRRHPVLLAQTAMTLAHLTKAPPILGIGAGERENVAPYGLGVSRPVARLEEALSIIRSCFDASGPIDFSGEHFNLDGAMMDLVPPAGRRPQIWIAAHGPRMLGLTGRYGDGWYPTFPMAPAEYAAALSSIRAAAVEAGRDPKRIVPAWQSLVVLARTEREARKLLDSKMVRFSALLIPDYLWQRHGLTHPLGKGFRGMIDFVPESTDPAAITAAMDQVPVDFVAASILWGTPGAVRLRLEDYVDVGLRHIVLVPISAGVSRHNAVHSMWAMVGILRKVRRSGNARVASP